MKKSSTNVIPMAEVIDLISWEPNELYEDTFNSVPNGFSVDSSPNGRLGNHAVTSSSPVEQNFPNNQAWSPWEPQDLLIFSPRRPHPEPTSPAPAVPPPPVKEDTCARDQELAARVLAEARIKSADLLHKAKEEATAITLRAHLEGQTAAEAEAATLLQSATAIVEEVQAWRDALLTQSEPIVLALIEDIARTLFGEGYALEGAKLQKVFERALAEAKNLGDVRIHVHPEDAALLGPHWDAQQTSAHNQKIELIPDEQIKRGGCLITGAYGSVDARMDHQLETVVETLRHTLTNDQEDRS
jgi:flagellar assembly protein FliH